MNRIKNGIILLILGIFIFIEAITSKVVIPPFIVIYILIFTIILVMFILFAFLKIDETNTDRYFVYILKFVFRKKKYVLEKGKGQW